MVSESNTEKKLPVALIKYNKPTSFDFAEYGTKWKVYDDNKHQYFIQVSEDESHPRWERMADLLECSFEDLYDHDPFVIECLRIFNHKQNDPLLKITAIIKEQQTAKV